MWAQSSPRVRRSGRRGSHWSSVSPRRRVLQTHRSHRRCVRPNCPQTTYGAKARLACKSFLPLRTNTFNHRARFKNPLSIRSLTCQAILQRLLSDIRILHLSFIEPTHSKEYRLGLRHCKIKQPNLAVRCVEQTVKHTKLSLVGTPNSSSTVSHHLPPPPGLAPAAFFTSLISLAN